VIAYFASNSKACILRKTENSGEKCGLEYHPYYEHPTRKTDRKKQNTYGDSLKALINLRKGLKYGKSVIDK
jgi:hypothetical protein